MTHRKIQLRGVIDIVRSDSAASMTPRSQKCLFKFSMFFSSSKSQFYDIFPEHNLFGIKMYDPNNLLVDCRVSKFGRYFSAINVFFFIKKTSRGQVRQLCHWYFWVKLSGVIDTVEFYMTPRGHKKIIVTIPMIDFKGNQIKKNAVQFVEDHWYNRTKKLAI